MFPRILLILSLLFSVNVYAEQSKTFGNYKVHYSAFTADMLTKEIAKAYKIKRSHSTVLINITLMKETGEPLPIAHKAKVEIKGRNLVGQNKSISVREILEQDAVYYIGEVSVSNQETVQFDVTVRPLNTKKKFNFSFKEKFYNQ